MPDVENLQTIRELFNFIISIMLVITVVGHGVAFVYLIRASAKVIYFMRYWATKKAFPNREWETDAQTQHEIALQDAKEIFKSTLIGLVIMYISIFAFMQLVPWLLNATM